MKINNAIFAAVIVLAGCASHDESPPGVGSGEASEMQSICDLAAHGISEGLRAHVRAIYKTDTSHYAYLSNDGCGKDGVLNVGDSERVSDETVRAFYEALEQRCAMIGAPYVCATEVKVEADITIIRGQDERLAARFLKVRTFDFVGPD
jgi:hypothetical protein